MMKTALRCVLGVAAGFAVTMIVVIAVELLSAIVHPYPEDFDADDFDALCLHVEQYPQWALAGAAVLWGLAALGGTWTAGRIGNRWCALGLGLLILAGLILNLSLLPYPIWFKVVTPIVIAGAIFGGYRWSSGRSSAPAGATA